jgi:WD40 repeat protein
MESKINCRPGLLLYFMAVVILSTLAAINTLAAEDKNIFQKVWSGMTGNKMLKLVDEKENRDSEAIAWSPDGKLIGVTGVTTDATIWDFPKLAIRYNQKNIPSDGMRNGITFSPDGQYVASGEDIVNVWNASDGTLYRSLIAPHITPGKPQPIYVEGMSFSPDGKMLVVAFGGTEKKNTVAFSVEDGKVLWTYEPEGLMGKKPSITTSVVFSPDGSMVFLGTYEHGGPEVNLKRISRILYLDAKTGQMVRSIDEIHTEQAWALTISRDGKQIATGTSTGSKGGSQNRLTNKWISYENKDPVRVWDMETGKLVKELPVESCVDSLAFSKDGKYLFGAKYDIHKNMTIRVWDVKSGGVVQDVECDPNPMCLSVSPEGRYLAAACQSKICIYEIKTDK